MSGTSFMAFSNEFCKIAKLQDVWGNFQSLFRSHDAKIKRRADYHFSPKAGSDKWAKFIKNVRDPDFVSQVAKHKDADAKLIQHAQSMHDLSRGKTMGKIQSTRLPGRTYEIRKIPSGLGCTCADWRFRGSINPGYECKHIRAFRQGKLKAD